VFLLVTARKGSKSEEDRERREEEREATALLLWCCVTRSKVCGSERRHEAARARWSAGKI
jgi:hypothetical protein